MRIYLVQHGESLPEAVDPERPLSDKGRADISKTAGFLKGKITIDTIWHSTKLRARQTAEIIGKALLPEKGLAEKQGLAPNDPADIIKNEILKESHEHLMIVGHLPFMARLASLLLTGSDSGSIVSFRQGGVLCLELTDKNTWTLAWIIFPELL